MSTERLTDTAKTILDYTSIGAAVGAFFKLLPDIAALLSVVWLGIRIWETPTVQGWVKRQ